MDLAPESTFHRYIIKVSGSRWKEEEGAYSWQNKLYYWDKLQEGWTKISWVGGAVRLTKEEKLELQVQVSFGLIPSPIPGIQKDWAEYKYRTYYYKLAGSFSMYALLKDNVNGHKPG